MSLPALRMYILSTLKKSSQWMTVREILEARKTDFCFSNTSRTCRDLVSMGALERRPRRLWVLKETTREYEYRPTNAGNHYF